MLYYIHIKKLYELYIVKSYKYNFRNTINSSINSTINSNMNMNINTTNNNEAPFYSVETSEREKRNSFRVAMFVLVVVIIFIVMFSL